jgi:hypothetical protein
MKGLLLGFSWVYIHERLIDFSFYQTGIQEKGRKLKPRNMLFALLGVSKLVARCHGCRRCRRYRRFSVLLLLFFLFFKWRLLAVYHVSAD